MLRPPPCQQLSRHICPLSALGPSPSGNEPPRGTRAQAGGGDNDGGEEVDRPSDVGGTSIGSTGCKRKAGASTPTAAVAEESEEGEVRPYPGLVDGTDALLVDDDGGDDDQLVSVSCGARYTLALSRKKRAFVWGQVAPPKDNSGGGGKKTGPFCGGSTSLKSRGTGDGNAPLLGSFSTPRELKPKELLRAAAAAAASAPPVEGVDGTGQHCCSRENASGAATFGDKAATGPGREAGARKHGGSDGGSCWRISAAGCGPWYVVLGLEETDGQRNEGGAVGRVRSIGSGLSA